MSPILVRPVREQLEHDRVIRLLQVKLKRKNDITANIGEDQSTPVKIGQLQIYPDLILTSQDRGRKLLCTVEVETSESVNHLEARAQWAHLGRARVPFHLYVPAVSADIARRLATENQVNVSELWTYHTIGDQTHFKLAHRAPGAPTRVAAPEARPTPPQRVEARPGLVAKPRPASARRSDEKKPAVASRPAKKRMAPARRPAGASARPGSVAGRSRRSAKAAPAAQKQQKRK